MSMNYHVYGYSIFHVSDKPHAVLNVAITVPIIITITMMFAINATFCTTAMTVISSNHMYTND